MKNDTLKCETNNVTVFNYSRRDIGYFARTNTIGKEYDMVKKYIDFLVKKYSKLSTKKAAIFIEPQIETGYPDIVIVEYHSTPPTPWNEIRNDLSITDLKILYYIQKNKSISIFRISEILGFPIESVNKSVIKLSKCGLIYLSATKKYVRNTKLESYCRINKIIAIEAKIDKWQAAIRQANNNIWFATESYILLNKENCSNGILETCKNLGIGIILVNGKIRTELESTKRKFPISYASLQFNEWILRDKNKEGIK